MRPVQFKEYAYHISQRINEIKLLLERDPIIDDRRPVAPKDVRDDGVVLASELLARVLEPMHRLGEVSIRLLDDLGQSLSWHEQQRYKRGSSGVP